LGRIFQLNRRELFLFICLGILSYYFYQRTDCFQLSGQSLTNLQFINNDTFRSALRTYPKAWPPLYPSILYILIHIGISSEVINFLFFGLVLAFIIALFKNYLKNIPWIYPALLYGVSAFNFYNMRQYVSETMFIALSFSVFFSLLGYMKKPGLKHLAILIVASALSCLTRYFALFWILPVAIFVIVKVNHPDLKKVCRHAAGFLFFSLIPIAIWMFSAYQQTGYFSGMDRFGLRYLPGGQFCAYGSTHLGTNIFLITKTIFIDFFSIDKIADHSTVMRHYPLKIIELFIGLLVFYIFIRNIYSLIKKWRVKADTIYLIPVFALAYLFAIMLVWGISNNDPLYSRFLYPFYPYIIISIFIYYSFFIKGNPGLQGLLFKMLYCCYIAVNLYKGFMLCAH